MIGAALVVAAVLQAQGGPSPSHSGRDGRLEVRPPRIEADATIDGRLDEAAWQRAAVLTGFSQFTPQDGIPAADSTIVRVWYSPTAIYFGIRAYQPPGTVRATLADRDKISNDDNVQILIGTFHDRRQATVLMVNPFGVQADGILVEKGTLGGGVAGRAQPPKRRAISRRTGSKQEMVTASGVSSTISISTSSSLTSTLASMLVSSCSSGNLNWLISPP